MSVTRQQSVSKELSPEPTEALRASAHLGIWAVSTVDTHYCLFCTSRVLFCQLTCKNTKHMTVISSETEAAINGREKEKGSKQWTLSAVEYGMYLAWAARNGLTGSRNSARCEWESRGLTCVKLWESENEQVKGARPVRRQVWEMVMFTGPCQWCSQVTLRCLPRSLFYPWCAPTERSLGTCSCHSRLK